MEIWTRPWALMQGPQSPYRLKPVAGSGDGVHPPVATVALDRHLSDPLYLYIRSADKPRIDHKDGHAFDHTAFVTNDKAVQMLWHVARPLRISGVQPVTCGSSHVALDWKGYPARPTRDDEGETEEEQRAAVLMQRIQSVWARLKDVKDSLAHPIEIWPSVTAKWLQLTDTPKPEMDVIVRHARELKREIDAIIKAPRRVLKRVQKSMPLTRVQEIDRRSLLWLTRQPGDSIAERAGPSQRIKAVAREESFDTLENRVLRSYCELARRTAREYLTRNRWAANSSRFQAVRAFGTQTRRTSHQLSDKEVRLALAGINPNFVLQNNPNYLAVYDGWLELLQKEKIKDELWRWQARSWEEFCAVATIVALQRIDGARLLAAAPVTFTDEQQGGQWLRHDNPFAVFLLEKQGVVIEVQYRFRINSQLAQFGAPIWLRIGNLHDWRDVQRRVPVWPLHTVTGGLCAQDADDIAGIIERHGRPHGLVGGVSLRCATDLDPEAGYATQGKVRTMASTIGVESEKLKTGLEIYSDFLATFL